MTLLQEGSRVRPHYTSWTPGVVISAARALELDPRVRQADGRGPYVWVLHDDGRVGGWYPESLGPEQERERMQP